MFVEPALHRVENVLMLPSSDPSFLTGSAGIFDGAVVTGLGRIAV
jgi:hypothetical protein